MRSAGRAARTLLCGAAACWACVPTAAGEAEAVGEAQGGAADAAVAAPDKTEVDAAADASVGEADAALSARARYNLGIERFEAGEFEPAADAFLAARDEAGPDPLLRYRAAFNLGLALASQVGAEAPPQEAIATLRQSAAWFGDAVRLAPEGDDDARINLELVSKRILALADQLNEGERLEARLDRLIDDQRGVRDRIRQLLTEVAEQGQASEPEGFKGEFDALASRTRALMAQAGEALDLAAEERLFIEQTAAEERTPEQEARAHRLGASSSHLERARQSQSDARRRLRRLEGERGHRRADAALADLKRAREQLQGPVEVLRAVARDEAELIAHTDSLVAMRAAQSDSDQAGDPAQSPPAWLTSRHLAERQEDAAARAGGVLSQLEAAEAQAQSAEAPAPASAMRAVAEARPLLDSALGDMRLALGALEADDPADALANERQALLALGEAIERFADVKGLIEIAYADQQAAAVLVAGESGELAVAERRRAVADRAEANADRMARLEVLLAEEREQTLAEAGGETPEEGAEADTGAIEERYRLAEDLRQQAAAAMADLKQHAAAVGGGSDALARSAAEAGEDALAELRRLFFSLVEHLQALHAEQTDTHDSTATAQFESSSPDFDVAAALGLAAERQTGHAQLGDALAEALAEQADAANAAEAPAGGESEDTGQRLAEAAGEVRQAASRMHAAGPQLADAALRAVNMSPELEPALADQQAALEHLENALRLFASPQQQQRQEQDGGDQQQQQQQQQQQAEQEEMSDRQALRRLQAIRDREAERQGRARERSVPAPVEKDW